MILQSSSLCLSSSLISYRLGGQRERKTFFYQNDQKSGKRKERRLIGQVMVHCGTHMDERREKDSFLNIFERKVIEFL